MQSTPLILDSIDLLQGTALLEIISSRHALLTSDRSLLDDFAIVYKSPDRQYCQPRTCVFNHVVQQLPFHQQSLRHLCVMRQVVNG